MLIDVCENGLRIRVICIDHPKRKLNEVHYARCVGMPSGGREPSDFGIYVLRTGGAL